MKKISVLLSVVTLLVCGAGAAFAAGPELVVLSPTDGSTIHPDPKLGPVVVVQFEVKNFNIVDFTKVTAVDETQGHIHIWLDNQPFNTIHTTSDVWVFGGVKPGKHTLTLELVHSNHTPLEHKVIKTIHFIMTAQ